MLGLRSIYSHWGYVCLCYHYHFVSGCHYIQKNLWLRHRYLLWQEYNRIATEDTSFRYDAFVLYSHFDNHWVDEVLQPKLEYEHGLHLCLRNRDLCQGEAVTEQIIESMESSKKALFILTKSFLVSELCHFEVLMTQSRLFTTGQDLVLILVEPLPDEMVPQTLRGLLNTRTYVAWTENDIHGQKMFWKRIYYCIQSPNSRPSDLVKEAPQPRIQIEESDPSSEAAAREGEQLLVSLRSELSENTFICNLLAHVYGVNCFRYMATY